MERKTFLAVALALFVYIAYTMVFIPPKRPVSVQQNAVIGTNLPAAEVKTESTKVFEKATSADFKATDYDLRSLGFTSSVSNMGGSLHNLNINQKHPMPLSQLFAVKGTENAEYTQIDAGPKSQTYVYEDARQSVKKSFTLNDDNSVTVRLDISPKGTFRLENTQVVLYKLDTKQEDTTNKRETMLDEYSYYVDKALVRKGAAGKFNTKDTRTVSGDVHWAGFRDHFTVFVVKPQFPTKQLNHTVLSDTEVEVSVEPQSMGSGNSVLEFTYYAGPQNIAGIKKYGLGLEKIVAFSSHFILDVIAKGVYYTVPFLQGITHSWGLGIILVSLLIYGATYPLTYKSMMSMRKMQLLQPKIKAIQDRYKNDSQKLNAEIMEIYKREKVNPLGGCLPFLLQMPVFIALYQALWRSYYFQGKSFLWIKDLTQPDHLFTLPFSLPFLGNEFNLLPILMACVMFLQQKISAKSMVVTDEQQVMQQKMMMYMMPVFIGCIFYKFASGLSLYFTVFYGLSAFSQWKMSKTGAPAPARAK